MGGWENLPNELIAEIYGCLSRRDRLACSMVCTRWKSALDCPVLWRHMTIYLDIDLMEPSTMLLTREYYAYMRSLELGWANPQQPTRWLPQRFQEITKRVCRYVLILHESYVQLNSITFFDWFEIYSVKKIIYHLCRFLKMQKSLTRVSFNNANLNKTDCIKLLASCMNSQNAITYLDLLNCYHAYQSSYELSIHTVSCIEQLINLRYLKLDYYILSHGIIDAIFTSKNSVLQTIDITIQENDYLERLITDDEWRQLKKQCPMLKVFLHIKNVPFFQDIRYYLNETLPLTTFSLHCTNLWNQSRSDYRKTLAWLLKHFSLSLENVTFQIRNNDEMLDDLLLNFVKSCPNLQCLEFHGVIENMEFMGEICKCQIKNKSNGLKYFRILPKTVTEETHLTIRQILTDYAKEMEEKKIDIKIYNNRVRNMLYVYY